MKHKPDIKLLQKFLALNTNNKFQLAEFCELENVDSIYMWISRKRLPKFKRRYILQYINERLNAA